MQKLQSFCKKADRDDALCARLAHITLGGQGIGVLTQDEPLPRGCMGTTLTASLYTDAYLRWRKFQIETICKAANRAPLPSHIKQRLLLYGAHSKINHTHPLPHGTLPDNNGRGGLHPRRHVQKILAPRSPTPSHERGYTPRPRS